MMTERGIDELSRVLGGIENQLKTVVTTQSEDRLASAQYRTDIRREVASIKDSVQGALALIETCKAGLEEMKPKVADLMKNKLQEEGANKLAQLIAKVIYALLALLAGLAGGYFGGHIAK